MILLCWFWGLIWLKIAVGGIFLYIGFWGLCFLKIKYKENTAFYKNFLHGFREMQRILRIYLLVCFKFCQILHSYIFWKNITKKFWGSRDRLLGWKPTTKLFSIFSYISYIEKSYPHYGKFFTFLRILVPHVRARSEGTFRSKNLGIPKTLCERSIFSITNWYCMKLAITN